jgi:ABC transporter with metal-binding/Fe-S-binding domain ATP-binding protein
MKVAVLFSGGKDSTYCLRWAVDQGHEVAGLVTVVAERKDSYMYQVHGIELAGYIAEAVGLPQIIVNTSGEKEEELLPLREALAELEIDAVVSGAIRSNYQKTKIDLICGQLGLESFSPLWQSEMDRIYKMVDEGYEIVIVAVASMGLGPEWIGRTLDVPDLEELDLLARKYRINPDGEGGEFETSVLYGPGYRKRVVILDSDTVWERDSGYMIVKDAVLEEV